MDLAKLKSISRDSHDIALTKSNSLHKAQSDLVTVYRNHIFRADAETICLVRTLSETNPSFFVLDTNNNPVEITEPDEFLSLLIGRNQEAISSYHQMSKTFEKRGD